MKEKKRNNKYFDLIFTFKNVNIQCNIDDDLYDEEDKEMILSLVQCASKEINIDKSYVEFSENKHEDTFITEEGWNKLCQLVIDTNYGRKLNIKQDAIIHENYKLMILCYIYLFLENFGYSSNGIILEIRYKSHYIVEYYKDIINEWKYYPGKWQDWDKYKKK